MSGLRQHPLEFVLPVRYCVEWVIGKVLIVPLCYFVLSYTLLKIPWPGWNEAYATFFRGISARVYGGDGGQRSLSIESFEGPEHPFYTRIVIVNRALMSSGRSGPIRNLDLDTIAFGWDPTALFIALAVSTPISYKRRCRALFFGLLAEQSLILLSLGYFIWIESASLSLVDLTPFGKHIADDIADELSLQALGP